MSSVIDLLYLLQNKIQSFNHLERACLEAGQFCFPLINDRNKKLVSLYKMSTAAILHLNCLSVSTVCMIFTTLLFRLGKEEWKVNRLVLKNMLPF